MMDMKISRMFLTQRNQEILQFESDVELDAWHKLNKWELGGPHLFVRKWRRVVDDCEFVLCADAAYGNRDWLLYKGPKDDEFKVRSVDRDGIFGERIYDFFIEGDDKIRGRHDVIDSSYVINVYRLQKVRP